MKNILYFFLLLLLGLFGFGLFMHDFDIHRYIAYLSNQGATNFSQNFNVKKPNTWLSFLYPTGVVTSPVDELSLLEQEIEKFNNENKKNTEEQTTTGEILSGVTPTTTNMDIVHTGMIHTGVVDNVYDTGTSTTGSNIPSAENIENRDDEEFDNFFGEKDQETSKEDTPPIVLGSGTTSPQISGEIIASGASNDTPIPTNSATTTGTTDDGTVDPSNSSDDILQKRLEEYRLFKQTDKYLGGN